MSRRWAGPSAHLSMEAHEGRLERIRQRDLLPSVWEPGEEGRYRVSLARVERLCSDYHLLLKGVLWISKDGTGEEP